MIHKRESSPAIGVGRFLGAQMTDSDDRIQDLTSRVGALHVGLNETLAWLKILYGPYARPEIEALREDLINRFKNSGSGRPRVGARKVRSSAIDVLETVFDSALAEL